MINTPKKANLIFDIGMHKGEDTDYYLAKGFDVVAFEANPLNVAFCKEKYAAEIESGRLIIVEGAISESAEKVKFYLNPEHSWWGTSSSDFAERNEIWGRKNEIAEIDPVNLAEYFEKYGIPYYLKADIVGSEIICLRALRGFQNKPDYLSIRSEKVVFSKLEEEIALFEELGYKDFQAIQQDIANFHALPDSMEGKQIDYTFQTGASGVFGKDLGAKWLSKTQILRKYRLIFIKYRLFGDYSYLVRSERGRRFLSRLENLLKRPLPGWYDTHARHSSLSLFLSSLFSFAFSL